MSKTTDSLIRIAAAGGGMKIDAKTKSTDNLIRIAAAASGKSARIEIANADNKTTDDLIRISAAGKGCVFLDFTT